MGFQFSFITTAAILLLYSASDLMMRKVFKKRPLSQMVEMNELNQHAYCFLAFFRQAFALTIAVNLIALPMMLYYFQKFPLLSLGYNVFFPFLVSIAMFLLILGILGSFAFPPLGEIIHALNDRYTQFVLNFTYNLPTTFDFTWRVQGISIQWIVCYLCFIFSMAIYIRHRSDQNRHSKEDFEYC